MLVQNDAYLLQLSYYIHRNPVRAGLVKRLSGYKWSSYRAYAYDDQVKTWHNTDSAVSRRVGVFKDLLSKSKTLKSKFNRVKSLIKI